MDLQKTDEYVRAHWPAALLMAIIVIPATLAVASFFGPNSADGTDQKPADDATQAKLFDIETRLKELYARLDVMDRLYRFRRDDENRWPEAELARLYTKSKETAAIPSGTGASKGKP